MDRYPFGIGRLDDLIGGGAPTGSLVLLAGDPGAGAREFLHTAAIMNALAIRGSDRFELHYGDLHEAARLPESVHYVSFTAGKAELESELRMAMDPTLVDGAISAIEFNDLSGAFFQRTPVPYEWYTGRVQGITELGGDRRRSDVFESLGEVLTEHASGALVCVDSITDLLGSREEDLAFHDVVTVLKGLQRASTGWGGLILLLLNRSAISDTELGMVTDSVDGTFAFDWERGGSKIARTMMVTQFRGVLSRLEEDDIVRFETEITESGFDISDVRKIR